MALIYLGYKALKKKMGDGEEEPELTEVRFQTGYFDLAPWLVLQTVTWRSGSDGYQVPSSQHHVKNPFQEEKMEQLQKPVEASKATCKF